MPRSEPMEVEHRLQEFMAQSGTTEVPDSIQNFIGIVRAYAALGVDYTLMLHIVEWEWQQRSGGEVPGPESLNRQIKSMADEVSDLEALLREHGIELPD